MIGFVQKINGKGSMTNHQIQCFYGVLNEQGNTEAAPVTPKNEEETADPKGLAQLKSADRTFDGYDRLDQNDFKLGNIEVDDGTEK